MENDHLNNKEEDVQDISLLRARTTTNELRDKKIWKRERERDVITDRFHSRSRKEVVVILPFSEKWRKFWQNHFSILGKEEESTFFF